MLLGLNIVMFLAELIVGYKTSSLALIADAFHMLSDVLSQVIALYAIRVSLCFLICPSNAIMPFVF